MVDLVLIMYILSAVSIKIYQYNVQLRPMVVVTSANTKNRKGEVHDVRERRMGKEG